MNLIEGLYIEMATEELKKYLDSRTGHHAKKAVWYKEQADRLSEQVAADPNVTNNPTHSLRQSQTQHENKMAFFNMLAEHLIPNATYRLSQENCIQLELYARYF